MRAAKVFLAAGLLLAGQPAPAPTDLLPRVVPNDNRVPAGRMRGDTLEIDLEIRMATWYPEADSGPGVDVAAFAEAGNVPSIPAPMIRVPEGTVILARLRNLLPDSTLSIHGLLARPAAADDSIVLQPGDSVTVRFLVGAPGTYLYRAVLGNHQGGKDDEREQLAGALIVDPKAGSPPDRVFVINIWGSQLDSQTYGNALAINGRSWPWTERISAQVGDSLRWRVINASDRGHPMHLHGFYFRLDSRGDGLTDSLFPPGARQLQVTQSMREFETFTMTWSPDRAGNWLFHCHIGFHVLPMARINPPSWDHPDHGSHDPARHMAGLILGIEVKPRPGEMAPDRSRPERLRLFIQEGPRRHQADRAMGFVLQRGDAAPDPDSVEIPGSPLILTRGRPTDITVLNRLKRGTSIIHWHGIELESYSDGVAGWSGSGDRLAPSLMPGDSFVARLTLPRAGTFIYHTHLNDLDQLTSGLYGGIIVVEPDKPFDPTVDHLFVAGWDGEGGDSTGPHTLVNGTSSPAPLELRAGVMHRFRFVNIGPADRMSFRIFRDTALVRWQLVARDGAELPAHQVRSSPASHRFDVGETFDTEMVFAPGEYRLVGSRNPRFPFYVRRLIVR
jgi:FtsP/CotA-like multicopper oxidase with cupredoxin domain